MYVKLAKVFKSGFMVFRLDIPLPVRIPLRGLIYIGWPSMFDLFKSRKSRWFTVTINWNSL